MYIFIGPQNLRSEVQWFDQTWWCVCVCRWQERLFCPWAASEYNERRSDLRLVAQAIEKDHPRGKCHNHDKESCNVAVS